MDADILVNKSVLSTTKTQVISVPDFPAEMRQRADFKSYYHLLLKKKKKIFTYFVNEMKPVLEKYDEQSIFRLEKHEWNKFLHLLARQSPKILHFGYER